MPTNKAFETQFRERFENLEETPPAFAWNRIRQEITPEPGVKAKPKTPKFTWLMPGLVISLISVSLLFLVKFNKAEETRKVTQPTEYVLEAEPNQLSEPTTEITLPQAAEIATAPEKKPAFKAYEPKAEKPAAAEQPFVKKRYLNGAEKSEKEPVVATKKKLNATKVVYVVTVDPKSASVEKVSTAVTDSAATGTLN